MAYFFISRLQPQVLQVFINGEGNDRFLKADGEYMGQAPECGALRSCLPNSSTTATPRSRRLLEPSRTAEASNVAWDWDVTLAQLQEYHQKQGESAASGSARAPSRRLTFLGFRAECDSHEAPQRHDEQVRRNAKIKLLQKLVIQSYWVHSL